VFQNNPLKGASPLIPDNFSPADADHGRARKIIKARRLAKEQTMCNRRSMSM